MSEPWESFKYSFSLYSIGDVKMAELKFKVDISPELKDEFREALNKVVNEFVEDVEFSLAERIVSKSRLTKGQAFKLANEVKLGVAKKHGL